MCEEKIDRSKMIRDRSFFTRPAEELAKDLIGKLICYRDIDEKGRVFAIKERICVTEAYRPIDDVTDANVSGKSKSQLLEGGHLHYYSGRLDIVAGQSGEAESVLLRGLDGYASQVGTTVDAIGIRKEDEIDGLDLLDENGIIWLEDDGTVATLKAPAKRKGIEKSKYADALLQFSAKSFTFPD